MDISYLPNSLCFVQRKGGEERQGEGKDFNEGEKRGREISLFNLIEGEIK